MTMTTPSLIPTTTCPTAGFLLPPSIPSSWSPPGAATSFSRPHPCIIRSSPFPSSPSPPTTRCFAIGPPRPGSVSADGKAQKSSFYKRPSKAIEMGGGFFIPGLEGYKLRLATAVVVVVLLALNRFPGYDITSSQATSEVVGAGAALILLAQALIEKLITDAGTRGDDDDDEDAPAAEMTSGSSIGMAASSSSSSSSSSSMLEEECLGMNDPKLEDDLRWAGYALDENLGCPAVVVLHGERGLVYYRRRKRSDGNSAPSSSSSSPDTLAKALLQTMPKSVRRAMGMGDALAALGGVGGNSGIQLASSLGLQNAEGVVVVRVGSNALLAVAPPTGGITRDQAVWVERAGALLEGSGVGN